MILADASVWVDHLRRRSAALATRLEGAEIVCHPFVMGDLSLGSLRQRDIVLTLLSALPMAPVVPHEDVMAFVERRRLAGRGVGWVDAHLVASALVQRLQLWTLDRRLAALARDLGVSV